MNKHFQVDRTKRKMKDCEDTDKSLYSTSVERYQDGLLTLEFIWSFAEC